MNYNDYRELTNTIDAYLETGNPKTLASIQECLETKEGWREKLMEDLVKGHERYIQVFSKTVILFLTTHPSTRKVSFLNV